MSAADQNALAHIQARAARSGAQVIECLVWVDRDGKAQIVRNADHLEALLAGAEEATPARILVNSLAGAFPRRQSSFDSLLGHLPTWDPPKPEGAGLDGMTAALQGLLKAEQELGVEAVEAAVDAHLAIHNAAKRK